MNLLLLSPHELDGQGNCQLTGRRFQHLAGVLRCEAGSTLRAGLLNQGYGSATVLRCDAHTAEIRFRLERRCEAPTLKTLLLAIPRPKVLSRCLQHAAALGYERILLLRTNRVEKAHLASHRLDSSRYQTDLYLGLEQAQRVRAPKVLLFTRFRPFVEDELEAHVAPAVRVVGHLAAPDAGADRLLPAAVPSAPQRYALAIGPEGGFVPFEIECLQQRGFLPINFGRRPLRVESALSYITGQLDVLLGCRSPRAELR